MGDIVHSLPAVASIRDHVPNVRIGWLVERRWSALLATADAAAGARGSKMPLVDELHLADTRAWRKAPFSDETWREILALRRDLQQAKYDVCIDLQGLAKSAILGAMSGCDRRIGFQQPRERVAGLFYTRTVSSNARHIVEQNCSLAAGALGLEFGSCEEYALPADPVAERWADELLAQRGLREFVMLSPGAGWAAKQWPAEEYAAVARALAGAGLPSLVNHGPQERQLADTVERESDGAAHPISCSIAELIALTRRCRLFVGGDSGPLHLAVALSVPTVALFGPTDPARNGPYGGRAITLRNPGSVTSYKHTSTPDEGLRSISPSEVLNAASQLLGRRLG